MVRTQIQLPDPLYREVQRIAKAQDWSLAEVIRRGTEAIVRAYPAMKTEVARPWQFPTPIGAEVLIEDASTMHKVALSDADPGMP
jgi:hypothetical protein